MYKIAVIDKPQLNGVTYYRSHGPMSLMRRQFPGIDIQFIGLDVNPIDMMYYDIVYVSRPAHKMFIDVIMDLKSTGIPVWVDYDDNFFEIPGYNPAYFTYMNKETHQATAHIIKIADIVTVSTDAMKKYFKEKLKKDCFVIKNAMAPLKYIDNERKEGEKLKIAWRGSNTHDADIWPIIPVINELNRQEDIEIHFFGHCPTIHLEGEVVSHSWTGVFNYFMDIERTSPHYIIVPLVNNEFNQAKSNIAWLEGTMAGAACIAPEWLHEFNHPPVLKYKHPHEIIELINENWRDKRVRHSVDLINNEFNLYKWNEKRFEVLKQFLGNKTKPVKKKKRA